MKATRIFPSAPSCASGGIGAEQKKIVHMYQSKLDEESPTCPASNAWRTLFGMLQLLLVIESFSMLCLPATCGYK